MIFFFKDTATTEIYTLSPHDALPIWGAGPDIGRAIASIRGAGGMVGVGIGVIDGGMVGGGVVGGCTVGIAVGPGGGVGGRTGGLAQ